MLLREEEEEEEEEKMACNRRMGGPRAGPDVIEIRKIVCLCWDSNPGQSRP
jgi:hypothetical protein